MGAYAALERTRPFDKRRKRRPAMRHRHAQLFSQTFERQIVEESVTRLQTSLLWYDQEVAFDQASRAQDIAACNQSKPEEEKTQANLKIVEQVQIDEQGKEIKASEGAAPADPAGDGKATCPPVSIAMAGATIG